MPDVNLPYVDDALQRTDDERFPFWRHFHWGLYDDPSAADDSPAAYYMAAVAMTERVLDAAGVGDGASVLDVGCGFGGTLDHIRERHPSCRLVGVNIDERQVSQARRLVGAPDGVPDGGSDTGAETIAFVAADGGRLPVGDGTIDHVLAIECVFHFPSRKAFLREAARVLRPGGTLALTDFVIAAGSLPALLAKRTPPSAPPEDGEVPDQETTDLATSKLRTVGSVQSDWYGRFARPLTSAGYARMARGAGFDGLADDDVTSSTLPTYAALHRMREAAEEPDGQSGSRNGNGVFEDLTGTDKLADLARSGDLGYHVLSFRRRGA